MKPLFFAIALAATAGAASAEPPFWVAICRGKVDANYTQHVGGDGAFRQGLSEGAYQNYQTIPLRMSEHKPGHLVCGAVTGTADIMQVCADFDRQLILLKKRDEKKPDGPLLTYVYCEAAVKIH